MNLPEFEITIVVNEGNLISSCTIDGLVSHKVMPLYGIGIMSDKRAEKYLEYAFELAFQEIIHAIRDLNEAAKEN